MRKSLAGIKKERIYYWRPTALPVCLLVLSLVFPLFLIPSQAEQNPFLVTEIPEGSIPVPTEPQNPFLVTEIPEGSIVVPEALCFEGAADHQYFSDTLVIQIQKRVTDQLTYYICDIQTTDPTALKAGLAHGKAKNPRERPSAIATREEAVLAINGDNFSGHRYGIIIRNGELIRAATTTRHMLILHEDGLLQIIGDHGSLKPKDLADLLLQARVQQTWEFGPELIREGQMVSLETEFDVIYVRDSIREPRTAIGQISPLHYVVIVVDGRRPGHSRGISLSGLQQLMLDAGAQIAFNLDGGGSTALVFQGAVINRPSGGRERSVSDILYFK